jgi:cephalosporin hydroxylase
MQSNFKFSRDWTTYHYSLWNKFSPCYVLEIGSFEGRSALYWAQKPTTQTITCIDTWEGSEEHVEINFNNIESNFDHNISFFPNIKKIKNKSVIALSKLLVEENNYYDWIYVDGSHQATDVLTDAVLSFQLLKINGFLVFDDYLWYDSYRFEDWNEKKPLKIKSYPKIAIDNFVNIFYDYLKIIHLGRQVILEKINDF